MSTIFIIQRSKGTRSDGRNQNKSDNHWLYSNYIWLFPAGFPEIVTPPGSGPWLFLWAAGPQACQVSGSVVSICLQWPPRGIR
jgi:hypothetical protein